MSTSRIVRLALTEEEVKLMLDFVEVVQRKADEKGVPEDHRVKVLTKLADKLSDAYHNV